MIGMHPARWYARARMSASDGRAGSGLEVNAFRFVVALLPQLLTLMLVGARFDLLGGLNRTDTGAGILMLLFVLAPVATAALLVVEVLRRRSRTAAGRGSEPHRPGGMVALAAALLVQALALNLLILSQLRMH